jgi:hypothetical protein
MNFSRLKIKTIYLQEGQLLISKEEICGYEKLHSLEAHDISAGSLVMVLDENFYECNIDNEKMVLVLVNGNIEYVNYRNDFDFAVEFEELIT